MCFYQSVPVNFVSSKHMIVIRHPAAGFTLFLLIDSQILSMGENYSDLPFKSAFGVSHQNTLRAFLRSNMLNAFPFS